jgi:hypothetical protein
MIESMLDQPVELWAMLSQTRINQIESERGLRGWRLDSWEEVYEGLQETRKTVDALTNPEQFPTIHRGTGLPPIVQALRDESILCMLLADNISLQHREIEGQDGRELRTRGPIEIARTLDILAAVFHGKAGVNVGTQQQRDWMQGQIAALCWVIDHCPQAGAFDEQAEALYEMLETTSLLPLQARVTLHGTLHNPCVCCSGPADGFVCATCQDAGCKPHARACPPRPSAHE